jgi:sigma-B regulation protein RsbU (phosphoserine phosphatase)
MVAESIPSRRKQDREFEALHEVSRLLTTTLDVDDLLKAVVRLVVEKLQVKACTIRLLDESTGEMALRVVHGLSEEYIQKGPVVVWKGVFQDVIESGEVVAIRDAAADPRIQYPEAVRKEGIRSMLTAALMSGGKAIGALCAYTDKPHDFDEDEKRAVEIIAGQAAVGLRTAWLHKELVEKRVMERELELAERVQTTFMPSKSTIAGTYDICARSVPCRHIGGDFYELIEFDPDHLGVAIGDVSGKGVGASILMATTRAALRAHIESVYRVSDIMSRVNGGLCRDSSEDQFVSLCYLVLESDGTLTYSNAGHCRPMLFHNGSLSELAVGGPVLGVGDWITLKEGQARMERGDCLLLYTDGLTETFSVGGGEFGTQRLAETVSRNIGLASERIAEKLYEEVDAYAGYQPPSDDRTLVVVKMA